MQADTLGCCPTLQSDISLFSSRSPTGGIQYQADLSKEIQPAFLWMISVEQSVSTSSAAFVCICVSVRILHQCDVMMNGRPTKRGRGGEREGERKSDLSSAFLSLYFIMEITSFTPSTSPFISYCHWQNPFSICTSAVCVCVRVSMSQCARESQERGEKQQARCICTRAVAIMNSDCRSVNNSKQTHYVGIFCYVLLTD